MRRKILLAPLLAGMTLLAAACSSDSDSGEPPTVTKTTTHTSAKKTEDESKEDSDPEKRQSPESVDEDDFRIAEGNGTAFWVKSLDLYCADRNALGKRGFHCIDVEEQLGDLHTGFNGEIDEKAANAIAFGLVALRSAWFPFYSPDHFAAELAEKPKELKPGQRIHLDDVFCDVEDDALNCTNNDPRNQANESTQPTTVKVTKTGVFIDDSKDALGTVCRPVTDPQGHKLTAKLVGGDNDCDIARSELEEYVNSPEYSTRDGLITDDWFWCRFNLNKYGRPVHSAGGDCVAEGSEWYSGFTFTVS